MSNRPLRTGLVIKNDGLGDLILNSGLIASLARRFEGGLDLVVCEESRELAALIPGVRRIIPVTRDGLRYRDRPSRIRILVPVVSGIDRSALAELRSHRYDDAICLRRFIRQSSMVLMQSTRAANKYCAWQFPTNSPHWLARRASRGWTHHPGDLATVSELSYLTEFAEKVVGGELASAPHLELSSDLTTACEPRSVGLGISGTSSRWPAGYWVDFARRVSGLGWSVVLFGGKDDRPLASWIEDAVPSVANHVGSLSWTDSIDRLSRLEMFVGNDTGLSHLAALLGKRCLVIYGGGTFGRFFPWPDAERQYVIYHALSCFDCDWLCDYPDRYCMDLIHSEQVFRYFSEIVDDPHKTPRIRNLATRDVQIQVARRYPEGTPIHHTIQHQER